MAKYAVAKQTVVSMFTEAAMSIGLPVLKTANLRVYNDLGWLAQNKPDELRLAIGGSASLIEIIVDLVPHIPAEAKDNIEEVLESLRNAVTNYFRGKDLGLPNDYAPQISDVGEFVIEAFGEMKKGVHGASEKVRGLFAKFAPRHPAFKDEPITVLEVYAAAYPDDLSRLIMFIADLPGDAEDDWQRVSPTLPALAIGALLNMPTEKAVLAVRRMAKDTTEEKVQDALGGMAGAANQVFDGIDQAIDRRRAERAARQPAAPATEASIVVDGQTIEGIVEVVRIRHEPIARDPR